MNFKNILREKVTNGGAGYRSPNLSHAKQVPYHLSYAFGRRLCYLATSPQEPPMEPEFAEPIPNVTVSAGREVSLPCVVDNLGTFRMETVCSFILADSELEPMRGVRELSDKVQIKYLATLLGKKKP
ncbi:hypothetical protein TNCV_4787151 [Trichonephila clavipes]|nr:hypothetical protein TNCV_4787151 [Trichonephila clavipes]